MKKKSALNRKIYHFSVSYENINISDIEDIRKYFMKKCNVV